MLNFEEGNIETKDEEMTKKKKVKVQPHKRRAIGRIRRTVTVRGHYRSLPKPKPKKKPRRRR